MANGALCVYDSKQNGRQTCQIGAHSFYMHVAAGRIKTNHPVEVSKRN